MLVDVSDIVMDPDLGGTTFTRKRPTTVLAHYGLAASSYTSTTGIPGNIQPAATADAQFLPEGVRVSDVQAFFCSADISPGIDQKELPDVLVDDEGKQYRVLHVQAFDKHGMVKALAQRLYPGDTV